jgi:predicted ribosome quality control (RQC) complex YloA/Tae2 family protein
MKQTLNTHDIYALVTEFNALEGYRVLNIYDIDSKTICIKLNSPDAKKKYFIIESGCKFYLLDDFYALRDMPTSFCSKLRKHLKNKRLEKIKQINLDRVIDLTFGSGEIEYHIIGEFYASGNIIFTSGDYKILTLLHPYTYEIKTDARQDKQEENKENIIKTRVGVGQIYPFDLATTTLELTSANVISMFNENLAKVDKKIKLKQFVNKLPLIKFSSNVLIHSLHKLNIDLSQKISLDTKLLDIFKEPNQIENFIQEINRLFTLDKFAGYKTLDNVFPYPYSHLNLNDLTEYENFTIPISLHFQSTKPIETREIIKTKEVQVKLSKQEKVVYNIEQQIMEMKKNIERNEDQIDLLTKYVEYIQNYFNLIQSHQFGDYGSANNDFFKFVSVIEYKKKVSFELEGIGFELDYSQSVYGGREGLYSKIKKISSKLYNAEALLEKQKKILSKSDRVRTKDSDINLSNETKENKYIIPGQTKPNWFEQFNWFFTSDNLLFISGKTADQNEQIVKRYMEDSDIYIHSETFGSGSGIIKNPLKLDIPNTSPSSLIECGCFLISHTKAWESGVSNSVYWVYPSQVSKTPESGEYITKGSFIIRGQKNFIRVDRMELGFGIIFKVMGKEGYVGQVNKDERIEYALPILSTYSAQSTYKFKVKVIPGTQKITKALKEVMSNFNKKTNQYEKEAIKKISNDSVQKVLITKIRFVSIK